MREFIDRSIDKALDKIEEHLKEFNLNEVVGYRIDNANTVSIHISEDFDKDPDKKFTLPELVKKLTLVRAGLVTLANNMTVILL